MKHPAPSPFRSRRSIASCGLPICILALALAPSKLAAQSNPVWKGRTFVRVLAKGDPIPGAAGTKFGVIERFTLHDGKIHIVAGETSLKKGVFRWQNGVLSRLVYTDTIAPNGGTFVNVDITTDETEGALNFSGATTVAGAGAIYGFFEWRNGAITTIFDGKRSVDGKVLSGLGYPVRVGHEVVGGSQFVENGVLKNGIFRWDGTTLKTVIQTGDDLPGSLGGFTGTPGSYQIAFDGTDVAFVAAADLQGRGPFGMYRTVQGGALIKIVDGNDKHPLQNGSKTYFQRNAKFVNIDIDGPNTFVGMSEMAAAVGGGLNSYYGLGVRFSDGTLDPSKAIFGDDGNVDILLPYPDGINPPKIDGQALTGITLVDGHGDDVALLLKLADGTEAIYAAVGGGAVVPPTEVKLGAVTSVGGGPLSFSLPTQTGVTYILESKASLNDATWTVVQTITGDGSERKLQAALSGITGFFRVRIP